MQEKQRSNTKFFCANMNNNTNGMATPTQATTPIQKTTLKQTTALWIAMPTREAIQQEKNNQEKKRKHNQQEEL